jgi:hypothetical protein
MDDLTQQGQAAGKLTQTCISSDAACVAAAVLALAARVREVEQSLNHGLEVVTHGE